MTPRTSKYEHILEYLNSEKILCRFFELWNLKKINPYTSINFFTIFNAIWIWLNFDKDFFLQVYDSNSLNGLTQVEYYKTKNYSGLRPSWRIHETCCQQADCNSKIYYRKFFTYIPITYLRNVFSFNIKSKLKFANVHKFRHSFVTSNLVMSFIWWYTVKWCRAEKVDSNSPFFSIQFQKNCWLEALIVSLVSVIFTFLFHGAQKLLFRRSILKGQFKVSPSLKK